MMVINATIAACSASQLSCRAPAVLWSNCRAPCRCILRTDANWDGIAFCRSFNTEAGEWQTLRLPFAEFQPVFRAKTLTDGTKLDPSGVSSVQLMLSKCGLLLR